MADNKPKYTFTISVDFKGAKSIVEFISDTILKYSIPYNAQLTVYENWNGSPAIHFEWDEKPYTKAYLTEDFKAGKEVKEKYLNKYRNLERKGL